MEWNAQRKVAVNGVLAPTASEEILIYQTLLARLAVRNRARSRVPGQGAAGGETEQQLDRAARRIRARRAGIRHRIVGDEERFLPDFREFHELVARYGARNGLGQLVLKIAAPGVPDFYQGTELWQFSLVDPDNRRPVDYKRRIAMLDELRRRDSEDRIALIRELAADPQNDEMKLFVTYKALDFADAPGAVLARRVYSALRARRLRGHVCAFARRLGDEWAVAVAPRWTSRVAEWGDTELRCRGRPARVVDCLTGLMPGSWRIADLLAEFPVAMLERP